jgi:hypothetical protein
VPANAAASPANTSEANGRRSRRLTMAVGIAASLAAPEKVAAPKLYFA